MENATKALEMAGSILIGILILGCLVFVYSKIAETEKIKEDSERAEQAADFNKDYEAYNRDNLYGSDMFSLANKIENYNIKEADGKSYQEIEIKIIVVNQIIGDPKFFNKPTYNVEELPHVNNRKRLVRLLNKLENNESITNNGNNLLYKDTIFIGLTTNRDVLYDKINKRVDIMFDNGLLEEVESLKDYFKTSKALNTAIGYKEFIPYFNNEKTLEEVKDDIKKNSRHYAKRQYTFFNHQFNLTWFNTNYNDFNKTINEVINYINKKN